MRSSASRRWLVVGGALLLIVSGLGLWQALSGGALWRRAYPWLPPTLQGLPYRLRSHWPGAPSTPAPLPTVRPADRPAPSTALRSMPLPTDGLTAAPDRLGTVTDGIEPSTALPPLAPVDLPVDLPPSAAVPGARQIYQTWNNCGPATLSMALAIWGVELDQAQTARVLKPDPDDKNVSPWELEAFGRSLPELSARYRVGGDIATLRALLAAGIPVIVETWFIPEPGDEMGHYRLLVGYEGAPGDSGAHVRAFDSYHGPDLRLDYADLDRDWRVFNRSLVAVYPREREADVARLLGQLDDDRGMALAAVARAQQEVHSEADAFAWFNLGSSLLLADDAQGAAQAFDQARSLSLPWRMLWYQFGPFEAYAQLGRWTDVAALARANLKNAGNLEESLYWLGRSEEASGQEGAARASYRKAIGLNPNFHLATERLGLLGEDP